MEAYDKNYETNKINRKYYWEAYNCLSDPSLPIYLTSANDNNVKHMPTLHIMSDKYEVTAEPGSYVAISKDGKLHGTALVSDSGTVTVPIDPIDSKGEAVLVVTKTQYKPYINSIPCTLPDDACLLIDKFIINDSDNNKADVGESFNIDIALKNIGKKKAKDITTMLTTDDLHVISMINNANVTYSDINPNSTAISLNKFRVTLDKSIKDQHPVIFKLSIKYNGISCEVTKKIIINAPVITLSDNFILEDNNNDHILSPGESGVLKVNVKNTGHSPVATTSSVAVSPYFEVLNNQNNLLLKPKETVTLEFSIKLIKNEERIVDVVIKTKSINNNYYADEKNYKIITKNKAEIIIKKEDIETMYYPFNNYYLNNKSQMLYFKEELGDDKKEISSIAFDIKKATEAEESRKLKDFTIKMKLTKKKEISDSFVDMSDSVVVFTKESYNLTGKSGWEKIELDSPFTYDGIRNLIIEIKWGTNDEYSDEEDRTIVSATKMSVNTVVSAYYDDEKMSADDIEIHYIRPNIRLEIKY